MNISAQNAVQPKRCAIYTRKSSEAGLEQSFNSLHAQREACEAYIKSQAHEGWKLRPTQYDDGGISGGTMERPALQQLIQDIRSDLIDVVVVYKVDRLSRSLADFARMVELFEQQNVSFVSVTQHFNTSSSMGRLTLNVLLSFAQFEREVTGERIRDKIAASKKKGMWMGGRVPLGYDVVDKQMIPNLDEAKTVRHIYQRYLALGCVRRLKGDLDADRYVSKVQKNGDGGKSFSRGALYSMLRNPIYIGNVRHKGEVYAGQHSPILDTNLWEKVQKKLEQNRSKAKHRSTAKAPSMLAGLLFDEYGNVMSPTHTTKGNLRYRYYVNQALLKFEGSLSTSAERVPAKDIEHQVIRLVTKFLTQTDELLPTLNVVNLGLPQQKSLLDRARQLAEELNTTPPCVVIPTMNQLISRIELGKERLTVWLGISALCELLHVNQLHDILEHTDIETIKLESEIQPNRRSLESKLIVGNAWPTRDSASLEALQKAVRRSLNWNQQLLRGKVETVTGLAESEHVSQRYISSLIHLANLDPAIIKEILKGNSPSDLTVKKLEQGFPPNWEEQRTALGFTSLI